MPSLKLSELAIEAHLELGLPKSVKVKTNQIKVEVFYSGEIWLPVLIMVANSLHYRATGRHLIHVSSGISKANMQPFGVILTGDLELTRTEHPVGLIFQCLKTAIRALEPVYNNNRFENYSKFLSRELFKDLPDNTVVTLEAYGKMDLLLGM